MKSRRVITFLIIGLVSLIFGLAYKNIEEDPLMLIIYRPFTYFGEFLRDLSLRGGFYNFIAIIFYCLVALIPIVFLLLFIIKKKVKKVDLFILPVLSIILFINLYLIINPHLLKDIFIVSNFIEYTTLIYSSFISIFYSLLFIYLIFKILFVEKNSNIKLKIIVSFVLNLILILVFYYGIANLKINLYEANNGYDKIYLYLQYLLGIFIYALYFFEIITFENICFNITNFEDELLIQVRRFKLLSKVIIISLIGKNLILNLYQIVFGNQLYNLDFRLTIPLFEILIFYLAMFLVNSFIKSYDLNQESKWII